jgi:16S rRNA processing protein RimM
VVAVSGLTWSTSIVASSIVTDDIVAIGRVGPVRGVRGDVFVEPWTDDPEQRFAAGATLRTEPDSAGPLVVTASSSAGGKLVVHFEGIEDRAAAAGIRGVQLVMAASERPPIEDPDEFYDTDLEGLQARSIDGAELGRVREVLHVGGADYLVLDGIEREHLVPFVSAIVPTVDLDAGLVLIDAPEGLLEL